MAIFYLFQWNASKRKMIFINFFIFSAIILFDMERACLGIFALDLCVALIAPCDLLEKVIQTERVRTHPTIWFFWKHTYAPWHCNNWAMKNKRNKTKLLSLDGIQSDKQKQPVPLQLIRSMNCNYYFIYIIDCVLFRFVVFFYMCIDERYWNVAEQNFCFASRAE